MYPWTRPKSQSCDVRMQSRRCRRRQRRPASEFAGPPSAFLSLNREGLVDQLLAVRDIFGKSRVGTLFRQIEPGLIIGVAKGHDLHVVILESLDRGLVH